MTLDFSAVPEYCGLLVVRTMTGYNIQSVGAGLLPVIATACYVCVSDSFFNVHAIWCAGELFWLMCGLMGE
jgi:hypothetical protein